MSDCCRTTLEGEFGDRMARRQLKAVRRKGPSKETRLLIEALADAGVDGATVLDIGAGIGAVHLALLERGATQAVDVDASSGYQAAAREFARERGQAERVTYLAGDFVDVAPEVEPADVVVLDKVICCYPDAVQLVGGAADRARRVFGFVVPHDRPVHRIVSRAHNAFRRLVRSDFRSYVHPRHLMDGLLRERGFRPRSETGTAVWAVHVYERA